MEYEPFLDNVKDFDGTLRITIPKKICKYHGINPGDLVKILIRKIEVD